jgi:membrane protein YdbS with pleckstrin-like domain
LFCPQCGTKVPADASASVKESPVTPVSAAAGNADPAGALGRRRPITDVPEETLWEGQYSPKAMLGTVVAAVVVSGLFIVAGISLSYWIVWLPLIGLVWLFAIGRYATRRLGVHYKMTNQMFYHRKGILTRTIDRIEAIDIDDVTWQQGFVERMVGVGSIKISSRDRTDPVFWLYGIEDVENVARLIDKARRAERLRRGFLSVEQMNVDPTASA